jgi:transcription initiation factor IIF auxiliary subunit
MRAISRAALGVAALAMALAAATRAAAGGLGLQNTSRPVSKERWSWTVFLMGPAEELNDVECVEYELHSSFPEPRQRKCERGDPQQAFALTGEGWGVFDVRASVRFRDSRPPILLNHRLRFDAALQSDNAAQEIRPGWWK